MAGNESAHEVAPLPCDIITFDCYGTLIDWEKGISSAFVSAASADGKKLDGRKVLELYARTEPEVEADAYRSYAEVLRETSLGIARELGWTPSNPDFLVESLPSWEPFEDTNDALHRLIEAGVRLGILSNIDDALLEETRKHLSAPFELIITAEQVRSYKPSEGHFQEARKLIGADRWVHAAQSNFHDIVPTRTLGIPNAWINRKGEKPLPGGEPDREFRDLTGLAEWVEGSPSTR